MPRPRRSFVLAVGFASWLAAVAVAWGVSAGTIPVASWLDRASANPRAKGPVARRAEPRAVTRPVAFVRPAPVAPAEVPPAESVSVTTPIPSEEPAPVATQTPLFVEPSATPLAAAEPGSAPEPEPGPNPAPAPPGEPTAAKPSSGSSDAASCEAAAAAYVDSLEIGGDRGPPDLSRADYSAVLDRGSYLSGCGVPEFMVVDVCAAVQNGRARGVTVRTKPKNPGVERCVARAVRGLAFPSHPRLDVARTHFE